MQLNPIHVTVFKLLEGRLFRIPGYQRSYSWGRHQRTDLFRDIEEAQRSGRDHFMATVVGLVRETIGIGAEEFRVVELVDGQQRITTLVILLTLLSLNALSAQEKSVNPGINKPFDTPNVPEFVERFEREEPLHHGVD